MHPDTPPKFNTKITSESDYTSTEPTESLSTLTHADDCTGVNFPTREGDDIPFYSDSTLKLEYNDDDDGTDVDSNDLKPIVKELSSMLSKINDSFSKFSSSCGKTDVEHDDRMFNNINQSRVKQEILSPSLSNCEVKDELMGCQSCSYSDGDFGKLKSHIFTQHPTEAAVITNDVGETDLNIHDIRFFCIKETCFFSTTVCSIYEQHLLHCCSIHQTMTRIESDRLKSTITFVLDFHKKLGLDTMCGFLDFVSSFNKIYTSNANQDKISEDVECRSLSSTILNMNNSVEEMRKENIKDEVNIGAMCNKCGKIFVQESKLLMHTGTHDEEKGFKCDECKDIVGGHNFALTLMTHMGKHKEKRFKCNHSGEGFTSSQKGRRTDKGEKPFKYNEYGKDFSRSNNITGHMDIIHAGEKPFKCNKCDKGFSQKYNLKEHMIIHTGEKPFKCNECSSRFRSKGSLTEHMRVHTGKKPLKCNECGKGFGQKNNLTMHMRVHTGEKPFKCHECSSNFSAKHRLTEHMRIHTGEKPFKCNECGTGFRRKSYVKVHMIVHTGEKPFKCSECIKGFARNSDLTVHMREHSGEKPFKCNECRSSFSMKGVLTVHMRTHTGEKPFKCTECGKGFTKKNYLTVHMRIHTGEKPFKCNECSSSFRTRTSLLVHMRLHTGEKPFKCNECSCSFTTKYSLSVHMRIHTGEKPFKCNACGKEFRYNKDLKIHMRIHTGEK